jgi:putative FmdB family regulatory protein
MPIYEYRCGACGVQREVLQKMSDAPLKDCPECGKPALSKMVTAAGFQLKGSGWYATDFKHGATQKSKTPAETQSKSEDAKPAAKADDKPATSAPEKKADAPAANPAPAASPASSS